MYTLDDINFFLKEKKIIVAGLSSDEKSFSREIVRSLRKAGFSITGIHPTHPDIDGIHCYKDLTDISPEKGNLFIVTPAKQSSVVLQQAIDKGFSKIWIQNGCETAECIEIAKKSHIEIISKECIFMWIEPVVGFHKFHRNLRKWFGQLPKPSLN